MAETVRGVGRPGTAVIAGTQFTPGDERQSEGAADVEAHAHTTHAGEAGAEYNQLASYRPYPKQAEFHAAGATHDERLFMAGNQLGKTMAGGRNGRCI